jgi:hypothetical protein
MFEHIRQSQNLTNLPSVFIVTVKNSTTYDERIRQSYKLDKPS